MLDHVKLWHSSSFFLQIRREKNTCFIFLWYVCDIHITRIWWISATLVKPHVLELNLLGPSSEDNQFASWDKSLAKALAMSIGELDYGDIPFRYTWFTLIWKSFWREILISWHFLILISYCHEYGKDPS